MTVSISSSAPPHSIDRRSELTLGEVDASSGGRNGLDSSPLDQRPRVDLARHSSITSQGRLVHNDRIPTLKKRSTSVDLSRNSSISIVDRLVDDDGVSDGPLESVGCVNLSCDSCVAVVDGLVDNDGCSAFDDGSTLRTDAAMHSRVARNASNDDPRLVGTDRRRCLPLDEESSVDVPRDSRNSEGSLVHHDGLRRLSPRLGSISDISMDTSDVEEVLADDDGLCRLLLGERSADVP